MAKGGFTGAVPPRETSPEEYSGVWDITEQFGEQKAGSWPFQADDCAPKSLKFESANYSTLTRTPVGASNRRVFTFSCWVKRHQTGSNHTLFGANTDPWFSFYFDSNDKLSLYYENSGSQYWTSNAVFRDHSAWYHTVLSVNTTKSTSDRIKFYVNGEELTFGSTGSLSQGHEFVVNTTVAHDIGNRSSENQLRLDGTIAEAHFIDGQDLTCDDFGFFNGQGIWMPKRFTGDYSNGTVYSNGVSAYENPLGSDPVTRLFDGDTSTNFQSSSTSGSGIKFVPQTAITGSIELYLRNGDTANSTFSYSLDGGSTFTNLTTTSGNGSYVSIGSQTISTTNGIIVKHVTTAGTNAVNWRAIRVDGAVLLDASVGRNSFHLDFSDRAKDQSGLGNDFIASGVAFFESNFTGAALSRIYAFADSDWTIAGNGASASKSSNQGYADVITNVMEPGKCYAFSTSWSTGDTNGGWWFGDDNDVALTGTHPNEGRGKNSIGMRGRSSGGSDEDKVGAHGTFASANRVTAGNSNLTGFTDINPAQQGNVYWVVDRISNKVWASNNGSSWIKGGDPDNAASTPSFYLPEDGNIYFGLVRYDASGSTGISSYSFTPEGRADSLLVDSPVNGNEGSASAGGARKGNYATLNPLAFSNLSLVNGNLQTSGGGSNWLSGFSTIKTPESGKWFYECTPLSGNAGIIGIFKDLPKTNTYIGDQKESYGWYGSTGNTSKGPGNTQVSYNSGATFTNNDTIGVALDLDAGTLTFYKNGTSQGVAFSGLSGSFFFAVSRYNGDMKVNFGQRPFKHPVSGFSPLATSFLPEPAIKQGDKYVDVALWTGNGNGQTLSGFKFSPDLVWVKNRDSGSYGHRIVDKVRGATYRLQPHANSAQGQELKGLTAFNDDGVTLGDAQDYNIAGNSHVGWMWDAGEATTTVSVGGSNSQAFDQSQRWRDNITSSNGWNTSYPVSNIFNGSFDGGGGAANNGNGGTITFTPPAAITVTKLELSCYNEVTLGLPDGTTQTIAGVGGLDKYVEANIGSGFSFTGSNSITISRGGGFIYLERIRINGKELVDDNITINTPEVECKVRANQAAGFSIVKVDSPNSTSARVHGLSKAPEFFICKSTASADSWHTYWAELGRGEYVNIYPIGTGSASDQFGSQEPNPVSFYVKSNTGSGANKSGGMIYYLWHSVEGFSKFSSYTGTGGDVFVYCGFRPRVITIKNADQTNNWFTYDTARNPTNPSALGIQWDNSYNDTGITNDTIDILSNGFMVKATRNDLTGDGHQILFGAWAEHPFASNCRAR